MENKTIQQTTAISAHDIMEAMEQIRAGFTVSRIALGAVTLLYPLKKKDEKWAKKFVRIQNDYHKFLLGVYQEMEEEYNKLSNSEESRERADATGDNPEGVK